MTPAHFASLVREYTGTDANSFSDPRILLYMNTWKQYLCRRVLKKQNDYFTVPQETNLIAGQREYNLPADILNNLRRVDIDILGNDKHVIAFEEKLNIIESVIDEATITSTFSDDKPKFYVMRKAIYLLTSSPIIDVTYGLRIYASIFPPNWVSLSSTVDMAEDPTATSVGFPEPLHELLARKISISYKETRPRKEDLSDVKKAFEFDLKNAISDLSSLVKNEKIRIRYPYNDGSQF